MSCENSDDDELLLDAEDKQQLDFSSDDDIYHWGLSKIGPRNQSL